MSQEKVRKMSVKELSALIKEEVGKLGDMKDVEDADKAKEVDADEYADTLEKKIDMQKALKIKEHKALLYLESIRRQQLSLEESMLTKAGRAQKKLGKARAKSREEERSKEEKPANESMLTKAGRAQKKLSQVRAKDREEARKKEQGK